MLTELSEKVKLNGFNMGLTRIQFANNLVTLGLYQLPIVTEIAEWIYKNPMKGAFKGLEALGFNILEHPAHWTKAAFQVVLNHLSATLRRSRAVGVSTIFLKHVLCKMSHFTYLLCKTGPQIIYEGLFAIRTKIGHKG
jgi:hypothetical protein